MDENFLPKLSDYANEIIGDMPDGIMLEDLCEYVKKNPEMKQDILVHLRSEQNLLSAAIASIRLDIPFKEAVKA